MVLSNVGTRPPFVLEMPHVMLQFDMGTWENNRSLDIICVWSTPCKMTTRGVNMQDTPAAEHVKLQRSSWSVTVTYKDLQNPDRDLNIDHRSVRANPLQLISPGIPVITILGEFPA